MGCEPEIECAAPLLSGGAGTRGSEGTGTYPLCLDPFIQLRHLLLNHLRIGAPGEFLAHAAVFERQQPGRRPLTGFYAFQHPVQDGPICIQDFEVVLQVAFPIVQTGEVQLAQPVYWQLRHIITFVDAHVVGGDTGMRDVQQQTAAGIGDHLAD